MWGRPFRAAAWLLPGAFPGADNALQSAQIGVAITRRSINPRLAIDVSRRNLIAAAGLASAAVQRLKGASPIVTFAKEDTRVVATRLKQAGIYNDLAHIDKLLEALS